MNLSAHAIIRYLERVVKFDIQREKMECSRRWKFAENGFKLTDSHMLKWIRAHHANVFEKACDDLQYFCRGKTKTFSDDDLVFVVSETNSGPELVTVKFKWEDEFNTVEKQKYHLRNTSKI